jgi:hypothetical protein
MTPWSTIFTRAPRRMPTIGVPQASASIAAVAPGSSQRIGMRSARAPAISSFLSRGRRLSIQRTSRLVRMDGVQVVAHVAVAV